MVGRVLSGNGFTRYDLGAYGLVGGAAEGCCIAVDGRAADQPGKERRGGLPRLIEVAQPTYHRWRQQYDRMQAEVAKRLNQLDQENPRL